jgi:hypothetical protein
MKKFTLIFTLALLSCLCVIQAREEIKKLVVPRGKTYVKLNTAGQEIGRFTAGQTMTRTVDCAQVPCPETFGKDVVCWKCKERPETTKATGVSEERVGSATTTATPSKVAPGNRSRFRPERLPETVGTAVTAEQVVVPRGKTYVKLDAAGRETGRFTAGQTMARTVDCAEVPCAESFGKDVVCWKCKERPETSRPPVESRQ